ncbi:MAG TPA: hypothetical protein VN822_03320 [Candidatus Acidoferrales bacterium]|nr:hypothetical protein [Candidatus Acidoferrales bacterium]
MAGWKKTALLIVVACLLLLLLLSVVGKLPKWATRAAPWNAGAIQATFAGVSVREIDPSHAAVLLSYDLENKTETDYQLTSGPNVVIMSRLAADRTLNSDRPANLESSAFVPARNRTRIALELTRSFNWPAEKDAAADQSLRQLVASQVAGLTGFVLFDQTSRYQIELPTVSPQLEKPPLVSGQN